MGRCNFSINFNGSPEMLIQKASSAIKNANGVFEGDVNTGSFSLSTPIGSVKGSYEIKDAIINMQIADKPVFLSCNKIQSELQKYLLG